MHGLLKRIVSVERDEVAALLWSYAYFFCLLCGYYILRPVRDEMGIQAGVDQLQWLFTATFVVMLAAVPVFGWLTARLPRRRLLPMVYVFFALNLLGFWSALRGGVETDVVAMMFFVWASVFNLFVVSVFWSFMADLYTTDQAKRLYGFIAAGGTTGAIAGPFVTASLATVLGPTNLLIVSAGFLMLAVVCIRRLGVWAHDHETTRQAAEGEPVGGSIWAGLTTVLRSPYLIAMCAYLVCYTVLSTLLYFQQAHLVKEAIADSAQRTALFAKLDLTVNLLTLAFQVFVFGRLSKAVSTTVMLVLMPVVSCAGFFVLGTWPFLAVLIVFGVMRRAGEFALSKPTRETLFNILSREEKYKSKNFIDTVVYRAGDTLSGWVSTGLRAAGMSIAGVSYAAVLIAAAWVCVALYLGRKHAVLQRERAPGAGGRVVRT
ncbi:MAG: MFS transporter [Betaproteobacteria bacterium]|nr:MFS transporter [Betaproteobacteria bacterium]